MSIALVLLFMTPLLAEVASAGPSLPRPPVMMKMPEPPSRTAPQPDAPSDDEDANDAPENSTSHSPPPAPPHHDSGDSTPTHPPPSVESNASATAPTGSGLAPVSPSPAPAPPAAQPPRAPSPSSVEREVAYVEEHGQPSAFRKVGIGPGHRPPHLLVLHPGSQTGLVKTHRLEVEESWTPSVYVAAPRFTGHDRLEYSTTPPLTVPRDAGTAAPAPPPRSEPRALVATSALPASAERLLQDSSAGMIAAAATAGVVVLGVALYHLLRSRDLLANEVRARIFEMIKASQGVTVADLAKAVGVKHQTVCYHTHLLQKHGFIVDHERGSTRLFFHNGSGYGEEERELLGIAKDEMTMRVLGFIVSAIAPIKKDVADFAGITRTAASWHVAKLVRLGLVREERLHGHCVLRASPERLLHLRQLGVDMPGVAMRHSSAASPQPASVLVPM